LGVVNWRAKTREIWLEKVFRAGQHTQRVVVPINNNNNNNDNNNNNNNNWILESLICYIK
jgi:hypothetical protein